MSRHELTPIVGRELPEVLARVAEECGVGTALTLAASFGGRELYIPDPSRLTEAHPLAVALGLAPAKKVAKVLGSNRLMIPLGPASSLSRRSTEYRRLVEDGATNPQIARALGIHLRAVERRKQRGRTASQDQEPDLFD